MPETIEERDDKKLNQENKEKFNDMMESIQPLKADEKAKGR